MSVNPVGWFEIPVIDMKRAKDFYTQAFELRFEMLQMEACQMAMFPFDHDQPGCTEHWSEASPINLLRTVLCCISSVLRSVADCSE